MFDTGASVSAISINCLLPNCEPERIAVVKKDLLKTYPAKSNYTINGDEIVGFPTWLENVNLGGCILHKLYYYVILESKKFTSVLGNDFIDCCSFSHSINSDILINSFDSESYESNWQKNFGKDKIISSAELCCLLDRIDLSEPSNSNDRVAQMEAEMKRVIDEADKKPLLN